MVRLVHAEIEHAFGDMKEAHEALRAASMRLQARAAKITSTEARESFLERVPEHARILTLAREW